MLILPLASRNPVTSKAPALQIQNLRVSNWLRAYLSGLPDIDGSPIHLQFLPELTVCRRKLLTGEPTRGKAVHAASFLRERRIILEEALLRRPSLLRLMLTHEIFHFVWVRLSNRSRRAFEQVLIQEHIASAIGELGESSEVARELLQPDDRALRSLRWRSYICESFCDTAAWRYSGVKRHRYFRLAEQWRKQRAATLATIRISRA